MPYRTRSHARARPGFVPRRRSALAGSPETAGSLFALGATALVLGGVFVFGRAPLPSYTPPPPPPPAADPIGFLAAEVPAGAVDSQVRVTLLAGDRVAVTTEGAPVSQVPAGELFSRNLTPGRYAVRVRYRDAAMTEQTVEVAPETVAPIRLSAAELARIEYRTGAREEGRLPGSGARYFKRAARLDPAHADTRLWLALGAITRRDVLEARAHLAAVRRSHPAHPAVPRLERLLARVERRRS